MNMYNGQQSIFDEINQKADIVSIIGSYIKLEHKGANYVGICPFHQDTSPSLSVSPQKKVWKCFACGEAGSTINFVEKFKKISFIEAAILVGEQCGVNVESLLKKANATALNPKVKRLLNANALASEFYEGFLYNPENAHYLDYLHNRGLDDNTIKYFNIGYAQNKYDMIFNILTNKDEMLGKKDENSVWNEQELKEVGLITIKESGKIYDFFQDRITFPIKDASGYIVGFSGRTIKPHEEPKYLNTGSTSVFEKSNTFYNFNNAKTQKIDKLIICEGFMDVIGFYRAGIYNAVATMGTSLTDKHIALLRTLTGLHTIILAFDNDKAGELATIANGNKLVENKFNVSVVGSVNGIKDIDELMTKNGKESVENVLSERVDFISWQINKAFEIKKPLDDTLKHVNDLVSYIAKFGDKSLKTLHLKLLSEKSGLEYEDILEKYSEKTPHNSKLAYKKVPISEYTCYGPDEWGDTEITEEVVGYRYVPISKVSKKEQYLKNIKKTRQYLENAKKLYATLLAICVIENKYIEKVYRDIGLLRKKVDNETIAIYDFIISRIRNRKLYANEVVNEEIVYDILENETEKLTEFKRLMSVNASLKSLDNKDLELRAEDKIDELNKNIVKYVNASKHGK